MKYFMVNYSEFWFFCIVFCTKYQYVLFMGMQLLIIEEQYVQCSKVNSIRINYGICHIPHGINFYETWKCKAPFQIFPWKWFTRVSRSIKLKDDWMERSQFSHNFSIHSYQLIFNKQLEFDLFLNSASSLPPTIYYFNDKTSSKYRR